MTTLCERCFPRWADVEVLTMPALEPCANCGTRQRLHVFRRDPRATRRAAYGIPLPQRDQCRFAVRQLAFKESVVATCIYETAGPRFVGRAEQPYSSLLELRGFGLSLAERHLMHDALTDVLQQVDAYNAVVLPVPND